MPQGESLERTKRGKGCAMPDVPRVLHRIWFGPPMPEDLVEFGDAWRDVMPHWTQHLWDERILPNASDVAAPGHIPPGEAVLPASVEISLFSEAPWNDRYRFWSDIARLRLLYLQGGVYVDCDIEPLRPLDPLLEGVSCFAAFSPNPGPGGRSVLTNAVLGAAPHHPFVRALLEELPRSIREYRGQRTAKVTGPYHLDRVWRSRNWSDVTIYPAATFYPQTARENYAGRVPDLSESYTWHRWRNRDPRKAGRT
jgi:inositol phosphorylceramide mannosyltransferase catalytic subunit